MYCFLVHNKKNTENYKGFIEPIISKDLIEIRKVNWFFSWEKILTLPTQVKKLIIKGSSDIQGLISFEHGENYILVEFLESAPNNKNRDGLRVAPSLLSYACLQSFQCGFEGFVAIDIKINKKLIRYYQGLGAEFIGRNRMVINSVASKQLIDIYLIKECDTDD